VIASASEFYPAHEDETFDVIKSENSSRERNFAHFKVWLYGYMSCHIENQTVELLEQRDFTRHTALRIVTQTDTHRRGRIIVELMLAVRYVIAELLSLSDYYQTIINCSNSQY